MWWLWAVGGGIGAALGGPVGATFGAIAGGAVSDWLSGGSNNMDAFMASVSCLLGRFASQTGTLGDSEREFIATICDEIASNRTITREEIIKRLPEWASNEDLFTGVINAARENEDVRSLLLTLLWRMASRDNMVEVHEIEWINRAATSMGASPEELMIAMIPYQRAENDDEAVAGARETLGVTQTATQQEIKRKYKELSRKFHPDSHSTESDTLRELAAEKFAQVAAAYDTLKSGVRTNYWGIRVEPWELFEPNSKSLVRCYFCQQKCRLPEPANFDNSRCPKCRALLLFERDLANAIFSNVEPPEAAPQPENKQTDATPESKTANPLKPAPLPPDGQITGEYVADVLGAFHDSHVFTAPDIPERKLRLAIESFGEGINPSDVLLLYDNTVMGSCKDGMLLTAESACWRETTFDDPEHLRLTDLTDVSYVEGRFLKPAGILLNGTKFSPQAANNSAATALALARVIEAVARSVKNR